MNKHAHIGLFASSLACLVALVGCIGAAPEEEGEESAIAGDPALSDPAEDVTESAEALSFGNCGSARVGVDPSANLEAEGYLPAGYMLTGIGGLIHDDDVVHLRLRGQKIKSDGTLGGTTTLDFGTHPDWGLEAWIEAPAGSGIVAIGMREKDSTITTLIERTRLYSPSLYRFDGIQTHYAVGDVNATPEVWFQTSQVSATTAEESRTYITGVGLRAHDNDIVAMKVSYCRIIP